MSSSLSCNVGLAPLGPSIASFQSSVRSECAEGASEAASICLETVSRVSHSLFQCQHSIVAPQADVAGLRQGPNQSRPCSGCFRMQQSQWDCLCRLQSTMRMAAVSLNGRRLTACCFLLRFPVTLQKEGAHLKPCPASKTLSANSKFSKGSTSGRRTRLRSQRFSRPWSPDLRDVCRLQVQKPLSPDVVRNVLEELDKSKAPRKGRQSKQAK